MVKKVVKKTEKISVRFWEPAALTLRLIFPKTDI